MLEKIIKKDRNVQLEKILEQKNIDEQAKNILQGILYKIEVSYKDYKKVKAKEETEEKYVKELLNNIKQKCNTIKIVKLSKKIADEEIQKELEKNKFFIGKEEIISYPIEQKLLYAIESKSNFTKILNNKYEEATIAVSNLINTGKNIDRVELLRDFNGWSWATINKEIENIEANLIYQSLQILLGEKFLKQWVQDKDGIIDYLEQFTEQVSEKYNPKIAKEMKQLFIEIAIVNTIKVNTEYEKLINNKLNEINKKINEFEDSEKMILKVTDNKKKLLKELNEIERILGQKDRLQEEFDKINNLDSSDKKIFNIKALRQQLNMKKRKLLEEIENANYLLNPLNFLEEKRKLFEQKDKMKFLELQKIETEQVDSSKTQNIIKFIKNFLKCFNNLIQKAKDEEEILKLIYQFRYFLLIPYSENKSIKDIIEIKSEIEDIEKKLVQKAIKKKVITGVPIEIMTHVFQTRIIVLEGLYYKITKKEDKYFVQLFDENVSEEKFEITQTQNEKIKINKKIKIFM